MRQVISTALVAVIVGAVAGATMSAVAQDAPAGGIGPAAVSNTNAHRVDGKHAVGFTDGVDDAGVTGIKITRVTSNTVNLAVGLETFQFSFCPTGSVVVGGGGWGSHADVYLTSSFPGTSSQWTSSAKNESASAQSFKVYALCMTVVPSGALTTAGKGALSAARSQVRNR